jgi:hypothetical protein
MTLIVKTETYRCPDGHFEEHKDRAVAYHIAAAVDQQVELGFVEAMAIVKNRGQIRRLFNELDNVEQKP